MKEPGTLSKMAVIFWLFLFIQVFVHFCCGAIEIVVDAGPKHQICFTSGQTIYTEALIEGRWMGRWEKNGSVDTIGGEKAFLLQIAKEPLPSTAPVSVATGWEWGSASEQPVNETDHRHHVIELFDSKQNINLKIHTYLDGTAIIKRWLEITNTSDKPIALTGVSPWSGRLWPQPGFGPSQSFTLGYFARNDWTNEGWLEWGRLRPGTKTITCEQGRSHDDPFFILRNDTNGEYFIGHLAWTTQWRIEFDSANSGVLFRMGPWAETALRVIAPGEVATTPAAHLGRVSNDLDSAVQTIHNHIRGSVLPYCKPERSHLIHYILPCDIGYYQGNDFNEANVCKNIDIAAAIGAEVFLPCGPCWSDMPMDWIPSYSRFPRGFDPIIESVHSKGMLWGLYIEAEGGRGNIGASKVAKEHPDWFGPGDTLNLTIPEAAAWMESDLCRIIEDYKLDLLWTDYNASLKFGSTLRDGFKENDCWRYYEAAYGIYERIRKKYPDLVLLQAAGGGGRNDLGTVSRFHETYLTDGLMTPKVFQIYSGQTLALPPEILTIAFGIFASAGAPDPANLDTYLRSTFSLSTPMFFSGMVARNVDELSEQKRERYLHYVEIYKQFIRPLLPTCKMYHHAPVSAHGGVESSGWLAMEYAAQNGSKAWAIIIHMFDSASETFLFKPRGLDPNKMYRMTFDSTNKNVEISGSELINDGVLLNLKELYTSELIIFEEQQSG